MDVEFSSWTDDFMDIPNSVESDVSEPLDMKDDIDQFLDNMSLAELHELRDNLVHSDVNEDNIKLSYLQPLDEMDDVASPKPESADISSAPIDNEPKSSDFSFFWDGGPTHDTDLDENSDPSPYTRKLTR